MNIRNNRLGRFAFMTVLLASFGEPASLLKKKRKRGRVKRVLTKKQRKLRAKNKSARKSRSINRK